MLPELPRSFFFDEVKTKSDDWLTRSERLSGLPPKFLGRFLGRLSSSEWSRRVELAYPSLSSDCDSPEGSEERHRHTYEMGLSNRPYWAANRFEIVELSIRAASSMVRLREHRALGEYDIGSKPVKKTAKRGRVREFSRRSRLGLRLKAAELQAVVGKPDVMITLTYPAEWRSVCVFECDCGANEGSSDVPECVCNASGKVVKDKHMKVFRKRLARYLKKLGVTDWGALWFFEFQARGAPHVHFLLWRLPGVNVELLRPFVSNAWAEVVGHKDAFEYEKHLKAGTRVEACRAEHFGYACKYAAKMEQKSVPVEFSDVGRFWGVWNDPCEAPVYAALAVSVELIKELSDGLCEAVAVHSEAFSYYLSDMFMTEKTFSVRVFGREASDFLRSYGLPAG